MDRNRVLIYDRDLRTRRALQVVLRAAGFDVHVATTAAEARDLVALRLPDAAIVEHVAGGIEGIEVCRWVREWSAMPLLVLSASEDEDDKVLVFEAAADDYVVKPFAPRELVARLKAALRRAERCADEPCIDMDGLEIDLPARVVRRGGAVIHLTPIEFKLLRVLLRHRGRMLTHDVLLAQVWGPSLPQDVQTLRTHMANLRRKIEPPGGHRLIRTDHGVGYRLAESWPRAA